jgi:tRNA threonylcarbamoyl adenosine modification protein (Sua5/YciO/YrdC/YwlC family)
MAAQEERPSVTIRAVAFADMPGSGPAGSASDGAVAAIRAGRSVILPTDTVYGLCADAYREEPVRSLARLKARPAEQPIALLAADLDAILDAVPELRGRAAVTARAILPGPYTLVVPNPARRFRWLSGSNAEAVGIRVPNLPADTRSVLERVTLLAATSANAHGGPDPARVADVPEEIRARVGAILDGGTLPGTPSTVVDLTGPEPRVLRSGAVPADEALARIARLATG